MNIERILLTDSEAKQAFELLLHQSGIDVKVQSFEKNYRGSGWEINAEVKPEFVSGRPPAKTLTEELKEIAKVTPVIDDEVLL